MIIPPSVACGRQRAACARRACVPSAACRRGREHRPGRLRAAGVEVVRPSNASAAAEAEFVIGALLQLLRRVPVLSSRGPAGGA
jgi:D-3-phosphoglycerate dehydrogenase